MKPVIDLHSRAWYILGIPGSEGLTESLERVAAAFGTGSVSGCQGGCLIEEEQFGVMARRHHTAFPPLELQQAGNPAFQLPWTSDLLVRIVEAAPVAHQGAS